MYEKYILTSCPRWGQFFNDMSCWRVTLTHQILLDFFFIVTIVAFHLHICTLSLYSRACPLHG